MKPRPAYAGRGFFMGEGPARAAASASRRVASDLIHTLIKPLRAFLVGVDEEGPRGLDEMGSGDRWLWQTRAAVTVRPWSTGRSGAWRSGAWRTGGVRKMTLPPTRICRAGGKVWLCQARVGKAADRGLTIPATPRQRPASALSGFATGRRRPTGPAGPAPAADRPMAPSKPRARGRTHRSAVSPASRRSPCR